MMSPARLGCVQASTIPMLALTFLYRRKETMPTRFESWVLAHLGAPAWQNSDPNTITLWRTRIGVLGTLGSYALYLIGNALLPGPLWIMCIVAMVVIFALAAIADMADGAVARAKDAQTKIGQFIDPVGDKFQVGSAFIVLLVRYGWQKWAWAILIILAYDACVTVARSRLTNMRTQWVAKIKSFVLFVGVALLLYSLFAEEEIRAGKSEWEPWFANTLSTGASLLWMAAALCPVSGMLYLVYWRFPVVQQKVYFVCDWLSEMTKLAVWGCLLPITRLLRRR